MTGIEKTVPTWALGPFSPPVRILEDRPSVTFTCPVSGETVAWAEKDVFNPGAVVHDGRMCLLIRAEDSVGRYAGTSRIGLATSADGRAFTLESEPVIAPADDEWQAWEWPGGCEDPRVVEAPTAGTSAHTLRLMEKSDACSWQHRAIFAAGRSMAQPTQARPMSAAPASRAPF